MSDENTAVAVRIWTEYNKGIDDKATEEGFKQKLPQEKYDYLWDIAFAEYSSTGQITPWVSKTDDTVLEKEINEKFLRDIINDIYSDPDKAYEIKEEIIHVQSSAPYNPYGIVTTGDPVNIFNGNFIYSNSDVTIDGAGMNFIFTRYHSHQTLYNGPLGQKWDHSYNLSLRVAEDSDIIYLTTGRLSLSVYRRHNVHGYWLTEGGEDGVIFQTNQGFVGRSANGIEFHYLTQHTKRTNTWLITKIID